MSNSTLTLLPSATPFSYAVLVFAAFAGIPVVFDADASQPASLSTNGQVVTDADEIIKAIAQITPTSSSENDAKISFFLALQTAISGSPAYAELVASLDSLDDHLRFRTYLIGHQPSASDWTLWGTLKGSSQALGILKRNAHPHLSRWYSHLESLPTTQTAIASYHDAKAAKAKGSKSAASFALGLEGAVEGQVVTRFPPEPSGYLHIGHTKAAILNQYFARMYKGKLIIRFDDTNPSKERSEFEQTILEDLELMGIKGDVISHTSDHFEKLYELGLQIIKEGNAYADDTLQEEMRAQRFDGIPSKRRDATIEENLERFAMMKEGTEEGRRWCIRAKISVDNPNKAMRDPVIYRCNELPHHRTGDKWKVYPTYDFACPLVDSIEGVTHALRTNEYRDRNPQYQWMLDALKLRTVRVWDFSRINFVYTLLSKRKLHWFVDQKLVKGWDDPRFPTVRGIRRRGMTVEALTQFMLQQGPSQSVLLLEWDSFWATNKKVIDPVAPRFWATTKSNLVKVTINAGSIPAETKTLPRHKKNPEVGTKSTVFSSFILVEQEDAQSFEDQEEITLMDWGNAFVRSRDVSPSGEVTHIEMELHLEGDFKKTKKKITWLSEPKPDSATPPLVDVRLLDYDYLITKKTLEKDDDVADFVTPVTEFPTDAFSDTNVLDLKKGDIIQFERKGYYIYDGEVEADGKKTREFVKIPDGKAAGIASKAPVPDASAAASKAKSAGGKAWGKGGPAKAQQSEAAPKADATPESTMYSVRPVYGDQVLMASDLDDIKMYKVREVYDQV
ncbi:hypothetical protein BOTBODRAFT_29174 [Botryobasidium botryosum FD-172 SS1]|uniref:glutamate--tRNA ligase n=1 Tax=Botryobasidium botryosum (strain FD-172 SS1) TaxID=930990 RepID=A0A067N2A2_BOTB1|nr:hypothetical protein BOTBODRAFT_29174 [Botryobasidium botryosum FD-172 SS1]